MSKDVFVCLLISSFLLNNSLIKRIEIKLNSIEMPNWIRVLLYIKKEKKISNFFFFRYPNELGAKTFENRYVSW